MASITCATDSVSYVLLTMGYTEHETQYALAVTHGDLDAALELLATTPDVQSQWVCKCSTTNSVMSPVCSACRSPVHNARDGNGYIPRGMEIPDLVDLGTAVQETEVERVMREESLGYADAVEFIRAREMMDLAAAQELDLDNRRRRCDLCLEDAPVDDMFTLDCPQSHRFCFECMRRGVKSRLDEHRLPACFHAQCSHTMTQKEINVVFCRA